MRIWIDTANLDEIRQWRQHPWVSGFTTNPTLMRWVDDGHEGLHRLSKMDGMAWAQDAVAAADGYPISIDGPEEVWELGPNVYRKMIHPAPLPKVGQKINWTAICMKQQLWNSRKQVERRPSSEVVSVFAGRIMDTGRDPQPVIDAAKATGAQVLWASVREPYNLVQAEASGCDIITVPPAIFQKYLDWYGKPLETVAQETIAQFDRDREGLWT